MDRVLYLTSEPSADAVLPAIATTDWHLDIVNDIDSARNCLLAQAFDVGLARLEPDPQQWFDDGIGGLCATRDEVPWVALVRNDHLVDAGICRDLRNSFFGFESIPSDPERLIAMLRFAENLARKDIPAPSAAANGSDVPESESEMVAVSQPMLSVFAGIRKIAAVEAPTLITGESGTGKELAAQAIHERSSRGSGPFIAVNCAALPASLIQSELFGHEKGSFTGAASRKIGCIESANGGTLFLDEIGDLPIDLQVTLLRFLQESTIQRVGSPKEIPVDVRVIAATHVDLERLVDERRFRDDLYFRLNVLRLEMPPLRDRGEDVEVLAHYFYERFCGEGHRDLRGFSQGALECLAQHGWPGNVRELINRVRRAVVMCDDRLIKPADLGLLSMDRPKPVLTLEEARAAAEIDAIERALQASRHNLSNAARQLKVSRPKLYRLLEKYKLNSAAA